MIENKRFVQNTNLVMQNNEVYVVCGDEHSADVVTTALNELINENEQLKKELDSYKPIIFESDSEKGYVTLYEKKDGDDVND